MAINHNDEKIGKFYQAILHYGEEQRKKIEEEVAAFKQKELDEAEVEVLTEAYHLIQKEMAQMRSGISREMAQREMDGLVATLAASGGNESVVRHVSARMEELDEELKRLTAAKAQAKQAHLGAKMGEAQIAALSWALSGFKEHFDDMTIHEKRDFVRLFVKKLEWDGKDLHIFVYKG